MSLQSGDFMLAAGGTAGLGDEQGQGVLHQLSNCPGVFTLSWRTTPGLGEEKGNGNTLT